MASWQWVVGNWRLGGEYELTGASSRSLTVRLLDPSEASFQLFGSDPAAPEIHELVSDLWVYRDGQTLYRGRVLDSGDDGDETNHTSRFSSKDYRGVLDGRYVPPSAGANQPTYNAIPTKAQENIAWDDLIALTQAQPGGDLGITKGIWPATGVTRSNILYQDGDKIWESIRTLSVMPSGFHFDIDPDLKANLYYPSRGIDRGSVLDYGGTVAKFTRTVNASSYANAVRLNGNHTVDYTVGPYTSTQELGNLNDPALFPEGRWEAAVSDMTVYDLGSVQAMAQAKLAELSRNRPGYQFTMTAGAWHGPDHIWVGDTVTYTIRSGRLDVRNEIGQVLEIAITVDANDAETVVVTVGKPAATLAKAVLDLSRRITQLGRS